MLRDKRNNSSFAVQRAEQTQHYRGIRNPRTGWSCPSTGRKKGKHHEVDKGNDPQVFHYQGAFLATPPCQSAPVTPAKNRSYLPATAGVPDVQPLQSLQTAKPRMGLSSWRVYVRMHHLRGTSFWGRRSSEGGWRAGVTLQGDLVQVKHSRGQG